MVKKHPLSDIVEKDMVKGVLSNPTTRAIVIDYVVDTFEEMAVEIGKKDESISCIAAMGSYIEPDLRGRWPRILLPWYPAIWVPRMDNNTYYRWRSLPSDFDAVIVYCITTLKSHDQDGKRLWDYITSFKKDTGVDVHLFSHDTNWSMKEIFGDKKYRVFYKRG